MLPALASDSGTMNISDTRFIAIWWPATGTAPRRAMKKAMKLKALTSTSTARPIGTPSRSRPAMADHCGRCRPWPHSAKRS